MRERTGGLEYANRDKGYRLYLPWTTLRGSFYGVCDREMVADFFRTDLNRCQYPLPPKMLTVDLLHKMTVRKTFPALPKGHIYQGRWLIPDLSTESMWFPFSREDGRQYAKVLTLAWVCALPGACVMREDTTAFILYGSIMACELPRFQRFGTVRDKRKRFCYHFYRQCFVVRVEGGCIAKIPYNSIRRILRGEKFWIIQTERGGNFPCPILPEGILPLNIPKLNFYNCYRSTLFILLTGIIINILLCRLITLVIF